MIPKSYHYHDLKMYNRDELWSIARALMESMEGVVTDEVFSHLVDNHEVVMVVIEELEDEVSNDY